MSFSLGLHLPAALLDTGFEDVRSEARVPLIRTGTPSANFLRLSLEHLAEKLVAAGLLTADELSRGRSCLETPGTAFFGVAVVAAWARRPASGSG